MDLSKSWRRTTLAIMSVALLAAACGNDEVVSDVEENPANGTEGAEAAGGGDLTPVTIGTAVERDAANAVFLVAEEQGVYEQCGLDVEVIHFQGGGALMGPLTSGEVDYGWVGTTTVIQAVEGGADLRTIAEINKTVAGWGLMVPEESSIQTMEDIPEGAAISFTSEGALTHWFALYAASQAGVEADDVVGVPLGGSVPAIQSALESGDTDAAVVLLPWGQIMEPEGMRWVAKFDEELPDFSFTGLHANADTLEDRETAGKLVGAYAETVQWMLDNREESEEFFQRFYELEPDLASTVYDLVVPDYNETGEMSVDRMQYLIDTVSSIPGFIEGDVDAKEVLDIVEPAC